MNLEWVQTDEMVDKDSPKWSFGSTDGTGDSGIDILIGGYKSETESMDDKFRGFGRAWTRVIAYLVVGFIMMLHKLKLWKIWTQLVVCLLLQVDVKEGI